MSCQTVKKNIIQRTNAIGGDRCVDSALNYYKKTKEYFEEIYGEKSVTKYTFNDKDRDGKITDKNISKKLQKIRDGFYMLQLNIGGNNIFRHVSLQHYMFILVCDGRVNIYQTWISFKKDDEKCDVSPKEMTLRRFIEHLREIKDRSNDEAKEAYSYITNDLVKKALFETYIEDVFLYMTTNLYEKYKDKPEKELQEKIKTKINEVKEDYETDIKDIEAKGNDVTTIRLILDEIFKRFETYFDKNKHNNTLKYFGKTLQEVEATNEKEASELINFFFREVSGVNPSKILDIFKIEGRNIDVYHNEYYTINWDHIHQLQA